ncbi:MAG: hypothetical protein A2788_00260 [Candidatus Abawacabacteria bacterium RIFCSPHIGHO2_01_FULL_46_8]|uniref:ABC transporter domain-containing protein n=1 Tax=Candidatus Abawacabacteria bacterium RIFCSPHIGHO2_01_FULL_46_8 TaxID=1817815 RepID=A0A1F4XJG9_9BACT|nr:MAG: hypothetical protein A2788_00260 [Candidatus Abawacabacteria bacterium RIFCSPHIGHO2_01_FULL_46_8]
MAGGKENIDIILEVREVYKHFGGIAAVDNCSFKVQRGIITGLIGPNGAGKTTVFDLISGFYAAEAGDVLFNNTKITRLQAHQRAGLGIARTFQAMRLFPKMSVLENLLTASNKVNEALHAAIFNLDILRRRQHPDEQQARELLALVGLTDLADEDAENLSYGQQKLTEIIRAMLAGPDLLLLDEPAAGVNPAILKNIVDLMQNFKKAGGTTLLIEHNMRLVMSICDHIIVLDYGKHLAEGSPHYIQSHPEVIEAYLGKRKADA